MSLHSFSTDLDSVFLSSFRSPLSSPPGPFLLPCYQLGSQPSTAMFHSEENGSKGMDPLVLIDAIAICMAYEEKELCKIGEVALAVIFDVASIILGSKERVRGGRCLGLPVGGAVFVLGLLPRQV